MWSRLLKVGAIASVVAVCWATSVFTVKRLQVQCGYAKPILITYLHELGLALISAPLAACCPHPAGCRRSLVSVSQEIAPKACALGLLAFASNCSFTAALAYTEASTAMTLEQLTPVFIALLSCIALKERYKGGQLLGLLTAMVGGVLHAKSSAGVTAAAPYPILGDLLVLVTCASAATYMVVFKKLLGASEFGPRLLFTFFTVKGLSAAALCWVLVLPFEEFALPTNACGWKFLGANMVLQAGFNVGLASAVIAVSPLAARLFILLGLPFALVIDLLEGVGFKWMSVVGITLAITGVATFEAFSSTQLGDSRAKAVPTECSVDELASVPGSILPGAGST